MSIVDGLEEEFLGRAAFVKLDANQQKNADLQRAYDVIGHPAFAILDGQDRVVQRYFGPQTEEILRQSIVAVLDEQ